MDYNSFLNETNTPIVVKSDYGMGMLNHGSPAGALVDWSSPQHPFYDANGSRHDWDDFIRIAPGAWALMQKTKKKGA